MERPITNFLIAASTALIASAPATSMAALGDSLLATGGTITATFEGASAAYDSAVRLVISSADYSSNLVFTTNSTQKGATVSFTPAVAPGTPLSFQLYVVNTAETWYTGGASNNSDGVAHANVIYDWNGTPGRTFVGFEDLRGGGDRDYNDFTFSFTNVAVNAVPEPETYAMMLTGLGLLGFLARRRKKGAA
jgi:hypothetical protein